MAINATIWLSAMSLNGRLEPQPFTVIHQPKVLMVESWNGHEWITTRQVWNGEKYAPEAK